MTFSTLSDRSTSLAQEPPTTAIAAPISNQEQMISRVLSSPSSSDWLKSALSSALERDPVDAANDADILQRLLSDHADHVLKVTSDSK